MKWLTAALLSTALILGGLLLYRGRGNHAALHGTALDNAPRIGALALTRDDGQRSGLGGSAEQVRLVFFGFTRCPDVCPLTLGLLARTYQALSPEQQRQVLVQMVTVDPSNDQPATLRRYLNNFDASFRGFTGTPQALKAAADAFYIYSAKSDAGNILHGDQIAVLDRRGHFRRVYSGDSLAAGELGQDLPELLKLY